MDTCLFLKKFVKKSIFYVACIHDLVFPYFLFFYFYFLFIFLNVESPSFQCKSVGKKKKLIIIKKLRKPCLCVMSRFNSLKRVKHFNAQDSNKKEKGKKRKENFSLKLFVTGVTLRNILKN